MSEWDYLACCGSVTLGVFPKFKEKMFDFLSAFLYELGCLDLPERNCVVV